MREEEPIDDPALEGIVRSNRRYAPTQQTHFCQPQAEMEHPRVRYGEVRHPAGRRWTDNQGKELPSIPIKLTLEEMLLVNLGLIARKLSIMRISEISVSRLFGLFDHVVPMNLAERVTIIHGPNGFGKTTLLQMVHSIASGRFSDIRRIPFRDFQLTFDDGRVLQIIRVAVGGKGRSTVGPELTVSLIRGSKAEHRTTLSTVSPENLQFPLSYVEKVVPYLQRVGADSWRDNRSGEVLGFEEVFRRHGEIFPHISDRAAGYIEPEWLQEFRKKLQIRFIESQRLLRVRKGSGHREDDEPVRPSVVEYSRNLSKLIQGKLAEYATLAQSLDRSFPRRVVEQARSKKKKSASVEALKRKLQRLEDRRASLTSAGLLNEGVEDFDLASYMSHSTLTDSVLPVYADDAEQKLKVFDDIADRIKLLTDTVNAHFQYKTMSVSQEKGFEFTTRYPGPHSSAQPLSPARLSSGEQHLLVLLYELLFQVESDSLIMIDEPEISLHVAWQLKFLNDIQRITAVTGIDVLIATHAPGIINDRMDLAVELKDPMELR